MFIRRVTHKDSKNRKEYYTYKLVESIRTERGPRQRDVLNLGVHFNLPKEQWKDLSNCIEEIITGQKSLIDYPKEIKTLAKRYARKIICEQACVIDAGEDIPPDYATIDLNSVEDEEPANCIDQEQANTICCDGVKIQVHLDTFIPVVCM